MARRPFGGTPSDVVQDTHGNLRPGATGTAWTAKTGGTQITDLAEPDGTPLTDGVITAGSSGEVQLLGPTDDTGAMWGDFGAGRFLMLATDVATRLASLTTSTDTDLSAEESARVAADAAEASARAAAVSAEAAARTAADADDETRDEAEESARVAADAAEASARAAAVSAEAAARATAVTDEASARAAAVTAEQNRALAAEAALTASVAANTSALALKLSISAAAGAYGALAGDNVWTGDQDFTGATVTGIAGSGSSVFINATDATYGATGDGVTDDRAAINSAIDAAFALGGGIVFLPAGNYLIGSSPGIVLKENVVLTGEGRGTSIVQGWWPGLFEGLVTAVGTYANTDVTGAVMTSDVVAGTKILTMTSTANLVDETIYLLGSDRAYMDAPASSSNDQFRNRGELVRIASIDSGTQVTMWATSRDDYHTATAASLRAITFLKGVGVRDLRIVNPAPNAHQGDLIKLSYCKNFSIQNVTLEAADGCGIHLDMCIDGQINGGHILDLTDNTGSGRYGYGILANRATENVTISNVRIRGGRHAFSTNGVDNRRGVPRNIMISNCVSEHSSSDAFDTHIQGANITFIGCSVSGGLNVAAFQIRSPATKIIGCSTDYAGIAVTSTGLAHGLAIIGNSFRHSLTYGDSGGGPLIKITAGKHILIKGNTLDGAYVDAIRVTGAVDGLTIEGNLINNPGASAGGYPGVLLQSTCTGSDVRILRNTFADFASLTDESRSSGSMTYPIDCQTATTGYTIADNISIGASQAAFVGTNTTSHTLRNNRQLDRVNGAITAFLAGSAPADADLATGELALYYDSTTNAHAVKVKAKNAAGTVVTPPPLNAEVLGIALSDETTAITTGTAKATMRMPFAMFVTGVRASLTTASSSGIPTVDINEGGTTILSTKLTIDASELTSTTAATAAVLSDTLLADDAEITFDIDVAGTGAAGLKVWIYGYRLA